MRARILRLAAFAGALCALLALAGALLLGTSTGTRWLWRAAAPYLPAELSVEGIDGSLLGGLQAASVRWESRTLDVRVSDAHVDIALTPLFARRVVVESLRAGSVAIAGESGASSDEPGAPPNWSAPIGVELQRVELSNLDLRYDGFEQGADRLELVGGVSGSTVTIDVLRVEGDSVFVDLRGRGAVRPELPLDLAADWRWRGSANTWFGGQLSIAGEAAEYAVEHRLTAPVVMTSNGRLIDVLNDWRLQLNNRWSDVEIAAGDTRIQSRAGSVDVDGRWSAYSIDGALDVSVDDGAAVELRVGAAGDPDGLRAERVEADADFASVRGSGALSWGEGLAWNFAAQSVTVDPAVLSPRLEGSLSASGRAEGRVDADGELQTQVQIDELGGTLNRQPVGGAAEVVVAGGALRRAAATVSLGANRLQVDGAVDERLEVQADFSIPDATSLVADARGQFAGSVSLSGTLNDPEARVGISGTAVGWRELEADALELRVAGTRSAHEAAVELQTPGARLAAAVAGGLGAERWDGRLTTLSIDTNDWDHWVLEGFATLAAAGEAISVEGLCLEASGGPGSACFDVSRASADELTLDVASEGVPLAVLSPLIPPGISLQGAISTTATARLADGVFNGRGALTVERGAVSTAYDGETLSADFRQAEISIEIADNALQSSGLLTFDEQLGRVDAELAIDDVLAGSSAVAGSIDFNVDDLSLLPVFVPELRGPEGVVSGSLRIGGTRAAPEFGGVLELSDGAFRVDAAGIELTEVNATLRQTAARRFAVEGGGTSGDGRFALEGELELGQGTSGSWLDVSGSDVELLRLPDQRIVASPRLRLAVADEQIELGGDIRVPAARLTLDSIPASAERASPDTIVHGEDREVSTQRPILIDIRAELGDDVQVSGFGLSTGVEGAIEVTGRRGRPLIGVGRLDLRDGEYEAYGQTLEIERGELVFNGPLDRPQLDIRAVREAGSVTAGVNVTGTPDQLRSEVFSEPALSDAEALSYLLTGRPLASASSTEGDTLNQAAFALGLSRAGAVTEQIRSTLGLETLAVEGGGDSGRIVAGKQLGGRLFVEYAYGLVDQLGTLLLRYQLNDRLVLETRSGAATALDLVYSVKQE